MTEKRVLTCVNGTAIRSIPESVADRMESERLPSEAVLDAAFSPVGDAKHLDEHRGDFDVPPSHKGRRMLVILSRASDDDHVTWTKLGDEWPEIGRDLSSDAYRTHIDALCWSNRRLLDLLIPKRDLRRFGDGEDLDTAVAELVDKGVWQDVGDSWWIGCRYPEWQLESSVIQHRREQNALRQRRHRLHEAGDHSICDPKRCSDLKPVTRDVTRDETRDPGRIGTDRDGSGRESSKRDQDELKTQSVTDSVPGPEPERLSADFHPAPPPGDVVLDRCAECGHRERLGPDALCDDCASAFDGLGHAVTEPAPGGPQMISDDQWGDEWGAA